MRPGLFARTADLRELITQIRAHEGPAVEILETQLTDRLTHVIGAVDGTRPEAARDAARIFVAGLAGGTGDVSALDYLWDAIDGFEANVAARNTPDTRAIERALKISITDLARRDPAAHLRLSRLLNGDLAVRRESAKKRDEPGGARGVLSRTAPGESDEDHGLTLDDRRELLRWRDILVSLLPDDQRPARRFIVPGGISCADPEGPRLSWLAISGANVPGDHGAFEVHLLSCDHCFEFHYRARHALHVLRTRRSWVVDEPHPETHVAGMNVEKPGLLPRVKRFLRSGFTAS